MYISITSPVKPSNSPHLIYFPPAGTLASSMARLLNPLQTLPFQIHIIDYPGRGIASHQPKLNRFDQLCTHIYMNLQSLFQQPMLLVGHSFGSYVALEVAKSLWLRQKIRPIHTLLSGIRTLSQWSAESFQHLLDKNDNDLLKTIELSIPKSFEDMRPYIITWLREDIKLLSTFQPKSCKFDSKFAIFLGKEDIHATQDTQLNEWKTLSTQEVAVYLLDTGHSFNEHYVNAIKHYLNPPMI